MQPVVLIQELADSAEMIRALLAGITQEEAQIRPDPDSWSILEVICHLYDEEREDFRQRLDIILHRPSDKWPPIDPEGWVSERNYNSRDLSDSFESYLAERVRSIAWLKDLTHPDWEAVYQTQFGSIKAGDMLSSWAAHDNLHIRQLVELRRSRIVRFTDPYDPQYAGEW
jgi:hypothetical protein